MMVPQPGRQGAREWRQRARTGAGAALAASVLAWPLCGWAGDRQAKPLVTLKLESLGLPGLSQAALSNGDSILTVDFLDDSHLLVTFGTHGLVPRIPGDPPTHQDRLVAAEVVDLPSGAVEARTEWHMHDHGRYLWNLGGGRFLVRIGTELSSMAPLANLASGHPFERTAMHRPDFVPTLIVVSPDKGVLTVESSVRLKEKVVEVGDVPVSNRPTRTLVEFYRVKGAGGGADPVQVVAAGTLLAPQPLALPVDADGSLWATEGSRNSWEIRFDEFGGKSVVVGTLGSTCDPQLQMVSRSEYVAVTCMGSDDHTRIGVYGLDGHEAWEEPMGGLTAPVFALAPGRFALLRSVSSMASVGTMGSADLAVPADRQELRVYQTESGDMLLKAPCSPVVKTAENFGLAEDGSLAAVVRDSAIVVYKLDAPDKHDLADMAQAAKAAPPAASGAVTLPRITEALQARTVVTDAPGSGPAPGASAAGPATATGQIVAASPSVAHAAAAAEQQSQPVNGDEAVVSGRRAPTLLKPGEKPEFGKRNPANDPVDAPPAPDEHN